jgi:hypothetical protein
MAVLAPHAPRPWYRHRWAIVLAAVAIVLLGGATYFGVAWSQRGAHEASLDRTLQRFRANAGVTTTPAAPLQPAAGVYTYQATGAEHLSVLHTTQGWGPIMPATVTDAGNGCWSLQVEFNTHHTQTWNYCAHGGTLTENGGATTQTFDFVAFSATDHSLFTCSTPGVVVRRDEDAGASAQIVCNGNSTVQHTKMTSTGTIVFVGVERLSIGGKAVDAYHVRSARAESGDQHGTDRSDSWFAVRDGMLLKLVRNIEVRSPSPIGSVTYTEHGSFVLTSLAPRR